MIDEVIDAEGACVGGEVVGVLGACKSYVRVRLGSRKKYLGRVMELRSFLVVPGKSYLGVRKLDTNVDVTLI